MRDTVLELYTGNVGSGKTYSAVVRMYNSLLSGCHVYTNIVLVKEAVELQAAADGYQVDFDSCYHWLTNEQIGKYPEHIKKGSDSFPVLLVIDEAHLYFNAREWAKTEKMILAFNSQTRKCHVHVICITQHPANLDKQFYRLCQFMWHHVDLAKVYFPVLRFQLGIPVTQSVCIDAQNTKVRHALYNIRRKPAFFKMFESTALLVEVSVKETITGIKPKPLPWRQVWIARFYQLGFPKPFTNWLFT